MSDNFHGMIEARSGAPTASSRHGGDQASVCSVPARLMTLTLVRVPTTRTPPGRAAAIALEEPDGDLRVDAVGRRPA